MLKECPHCLSRVLPMTNGACPSCQQDMSSKEPPPFTKLRVHHERPLPNVCCTCGGHTINVETVVAEGQTGLSRSERTLVGIILFWIAWPLLFLLKYHPGLSKRPTFEIAMPRCRECRARDGVLVPEHVNMDRGTMLFVVAREFANAAKGVASDADSPRGPYRSRKKRA